MSTSLSAFSDHWLLVGRFLPENETDSASEEMKNFFSYREAWERVGDSSCGTAREYDSCSVDLFLPKLGNSTHPGGYVDRLTTFVTLHFHGTGFLIAVDGHCAGNRDSTLIYVTTEDGFGEPAAFTSRTNVFGPKRLGLSDDSRRRFIEPGPDSDCDSVWSITTAFVQLAPGTPISPDFDTLFVGCDDAVIEYRGSGWTRVGPGKLGDFKDEWPAMRTVSAGDSLLFSFFGTAVSIPANNRRAGKCYFSFTIDGDAFGDDPRRSIEGSDLSLSIEAALANLDPNQTHTVTITLTSVVSGNCDFTFEGFNYAPAFRTLDEAKDLYLRWNSSRPETDFQDGQQFSPNSTSDSTPTNTRELVDSSESSSSGATENDVQSRSVTGPIVGGVVGFIFILAVILGILWLRRRRHNRLVVTSSEDGTGTGTAPNRPEPIQVRPYMKTYHGVGDETFNPILSSRTVEPENPVLAVPYMKSYRLEEAQDGQINRDLTHDDVSPYKSQTLHSTASAPAAQSAIPVAEVPFVEPRGRTSLNNDANDESPRHYNEVPASAREETDTTMSSGIRDVLRAIVERMDAIDRPPPYRPAGRDSVSPS